MISPSETIKKFAQEHGLDAVAMLRFAIEDCAGGFPDRWPGGSIWDWEGRLIHALARVIGASSILEFGTGHGCATTHLADALRLNGGGVVESVDYQDEHPNIKPHLRQYIWRVMSDGIEWSAEKLKDGREFCLIFEDGPHTSEFTEAVIRNSLPNLRPGGFVIVHDVYGPHEHNVWPALRSVLPDAKRLKIGKSYCGLGYWRKP